MTITDEVKRMIRAEIVAIHAAKNEVVLKGDGTREGNEKIFNDTWRATMIRQGVDIGENTFDTWSPPI